ncbi:hypothetical protein [uncultured Robinsoniella sp.]|uniref:hypothetical protein n=1 Tax=uncultured Robinsoniella sp. TaxID=904190 RepID=UPI00374E7ACE
MSKKISFGLSIREIKQTVNAIERYKKDLNSKVKEFCQALVMFGQVKAIQSANDSPLGKTITITTDISRTATGCKAMLIGIGQTRQSEGYNPVNTLLLIEFGSGIKYNPNDNPKDNEFGMGVGTFPGQIHAFQEEGWYYWGEDEQWHHSYGVKATMPMYNASKEMRAQIVKIAKDIFNS